MTKKQIEAARDMLAKCLRADTPEGRECAAQDSFMLDAITLKVLEAAEAAQ